VLGQGKEKQGVRNASAGEGRKVCDIMLRCMYLLLLVGSKSCFLTASPLQGLVPPRS
jgi:hypothetical protein